MFFFGTGGEFSMLCLCEAMWLLLVVDWLKGELLCFGKLHGLQGEYKHLCVLMFTSYYFSSDVCMFFSAAELML